jgi:1-acyl-sn-glycerol-3-phosphate acyltransferase
MLRRETMSTIPNVESKTGPLRESVDADDLLRLIQELVAELHLGRHPALELDTDLEADLGLDSLARMELLLRVQRRFDVILPERAALGADTPRQLLAALSLARSAGAQSAVVFPERSPTAAPTAAVTPPHSTTLVGALRWFAAHEPDRVHIELCGEDGAITPLTYGQVYEDALRVAAGLMARGLAPGESVALMLPTGREFFVAFLGIQIAGAVAVPIYPPFRLSQLEDHLRRQALILENARAALLIATPETARAAHWLRNRIVGLRRVSTVPELSLSGQAPALALNPSDVALLQYTSGSTGDPKGVVLTHDNIIANVRAIGEAAEIRSTDVVVSWLPLYHDMGLIGAWLGSLYHGCRLVVMPPTRFLARPAAWLQALHRHGGTLAAAPNFAYEMCASRITDPELAGLDLSAWRLALNGSEPVSPSTIDRFVRRFAAHGFRREAMTPVYGLAENAVALTFTPAGRGPRLDRLDRPAFEKSGQAVVADPSAQDPLTFVSCGRPIPHHEVRVVDELGRELPDRRRGSVQFRGPSATTGYFRNPPASRALYDGPWLNTGDLGYIADGELFVTGRSKDVIIRAGRHVFPYEVEERVGSIPGIRGGGVAVFAGRDEARGTEKVIVVAETRERDPERLGELRARIDAESSPLLGGAPEEVLLVPPRTVPKTSSGKTRRAACRELYLRGSLGRPRSRRRQVLESTLRTSAPLIRRALRALAAVAYAGWFWFCLGLLAIPAWALAAGLPGERMRWRAVSAIARLFFVLAGVRLKVAGREYLSADPRVLVVNHASYLDSIVLVAVLPPGYSLVAKRELERNVLLRRALRRLGVVFVERFDRERAAHEVDALEQRIRDGRSLVIFPEGTNRRRPGLFPFHLGAFAVAARTSVPIVPGGIWGSRTVLRADQWFPRRGPLTITVRPPLFPAASTWEAAVALQERARAEIAIAAREPLVE